MLIVCMRLTGRIMSPMADWLNFEFSFLSSCGLLWDPHGVVCCQTAGPRFNIRCKTSYRKISWSSEAARFVFWTVRSLWNLTGTSAALLPTPRQHCCRCACEISKRCDVLNCQSRGFETSRDLATRRLIGYWNRAQVSTFLCRIRLSIERVNTTGTEMAPCRIPSRASARISCLSPKVNGPGMCKRPKIAANT